MPEQQAQLMQHRVRDLLIGQRTQAINALRSHMAELGIVAAKGYEGLKVLLAIVADASDSRLPENARASLSALVAQIASCQAESTVIDKRLIMQHRKNPDSKRLETIPGIGVIGASAIVATVPDASIFNRGRDFAAGSASSRAKILPEAGTGLPRSPWQTRWRVSPGRC
jgi:transposase